MRALQWLGKKHVGVKEMPKPMITDQVCVWWWCFGGYSWLAVSKGMPCTCDCSPAGCIVFVTAAPAVHVPLLQHLSVSTVIWHQGVTYMLAKMIACSPQHPQLMAMLMLLCCCAHHPLLSLYDTSCSG